MNQDLIVAHEQFLTPSAQLADYVLPADSWLERPWLSDMFGWTSYYRPSEKSMEPPGECESTFSFLKRLAGALDRPEVIPWETIEELYDWRLEKTGMTFDEFSKTHEAYFIAPEYQKYCKTGFATPSGKVELASSILEDLGFDPLPYFREDPPAPEGFDLMLFTGVREDGYFQTGHRHIPELRARQPEPNCFLSPATAEGFGPRGGRLGLGGDGEGLLHDAAGHQDQHAGRARASAPRVVEARAGSRPRSRSVGRSEALRCPADRGRR